MDVQDQCNEASDAVGQVRARPAVFVAVFVEETGGQRGLAAEKHLGEDGNEG